MTKLKFIEVPHAVQCPNCKRLMITKTTGDDQVKVQCFYCGYKQKYQLPRAL